MSRAASHAPVDVVATWKRIAANLKVMTDAEKTQTLVDAGILTKNRNVSKRYRKVIVPIKKK